MRKTGTILLPLIALLLLSCSSDTIYGPVGNFSEGLALVPVEGKWGYIDTTGKVAIEPQFDAALPFQHGVAIVSKAKKMGVIDRTGRILTPLEYDEITGFVAGYSPCRKGETWGYLALDGSLVVEPAYAAVGDFGDGLAPVQKESGGEKLWGYIDTTGAVVINVQYEDALIYSNGLAWAKQPSEEASAWTVIDTAGNVILSDAELLEVRPFVEGYAVVMKRILVEIDGKERLKQRWGFVGIDGTYLVEPAYVHVRGFHERMAAVQDVVEDMPNDIEGFWGFIDHTGELVIDPTYFTVSDFREGVSVVELDIEVDTLPEALQKATEPLQYKGHVRMQALLNRAGVQVAPPRFNYIGPFKNGLAAVRQGIFPMQKWGYIDRSGDLVVDLQYARALDFHAGLAGVAEHQAEGDEALELFGYIDLAGRQVIPFEYNKAGPFVDGRARVTKDDTWQFIDRQGQVVWSQHQL